MAEDQKHLPEEEEVKTPWQITKESWYDRMNLTVKQLDIIIGICFALLAGTAVLIALDVMDIFHLFG